MLDGGQSAARGSKMSGKKMVEVERWIDRVGGVGELNIYQSAGLTTLVLVNT